uniref:D-alanyl-D-alanine carboxypeptidase family protein n=1 Tax=Altererythrobacter segetis TaxID=1104773 RepID=UPI001FAF150E|nr:D-alanyl-D-alanine carboxypeptidase family protein [Altererythrobacter segetis]
MTIVACLAVLASVGSAAAPSPVESDAADSSPVDPEIPVALLVDLSTGQTLFAREPDRRFVPASVTKVMSVYTAFDLIDRGKLSLDRVVTIDKEVADEWGGEGSTLFLKEGDQLTVGELLLGVTTVSANDGAVALAKAAAGSVDNWIALMNQNAARLGMHDSHFGLPNGYMDEGRTYTSARDLIRLAEVLTTRFPGLYKRFIGHHGMRYHGITQNNHDPITGIVPGADGIKTGYTEQAGYNFLGSAERGGRRLAMVIAGAPSPAIRNKSSRQLIEWGFEHFASRELLPKGTLVGEAMVQDGSATSVTLFTEAPVFANLPLGQDAGAQLRLRYRGPIEAPIRQGDEVATLRIAIAGQEPHDVPLIAGANVGKANAWQRLRNGVASLLR